MPHTFTATTLRRTDRMQYTNLQPTPVFSSDPAAGHSDRRQRHGPGLTATSDIIQMSHDDHTIAGHGIIKNRGKQVAIHGTKPLVSAPASQRRLLAHKPRWIIRRATPSQQGHAKTNGQDQRPRPKRPPNGPQMTIIVTKIHT